jgi:hypothetical protein
MALEINALDILNTIMVGAILFLQIGLVIAKRLKHSECSTDFSGGDSPKPAHG